MKGEPAAFRKERVEATRDFLAGVDAATPTHLELASLADPAFVKLIANNLVGTVDSLGLNEQELKLLVSTSQSFPFPSLPFRTFALFPLSHTHCRTRMYP